MRRAPYEERAISGDFLNELRVEHARISARSRHNREIGQALDLFGFLKIADPVHPCDDLGDADG
jgi:hypothetical protein